MKFYIPHTFNFFAWILALEQDIVIRNILEVLIDNVMDLLFTTFDLSDLGFVLSLICASRHLDFLYLLSRMGETLSHFLYNVADVVYSRLEILVNKILWFLLGILWLHFINTNNNFGKKKKKKFNRGWAKRRKKIRKFREIQLVLVWTYLQLIIYIRGPMRGDAEGIYPS